MSNIYLKSDVGVFQMFVSLREHLVDLAVYCRDLLIVVPISGW